MIRGFRAARIFDGERLREGGTLVVEDGQVAAVLDAGAPAPGIAVEDLVAGVIAPGFIDLQVNGGGGEMLGAGADADAIARICAAHALLGATGILPTLITDRPEVTAQVIGAGLAAARARVPGFLGLHLEGPHLDPSRAGAHDPALIRPMTDADLNALEAAARALPALMLTLAPEAATPAQIARLARAGAVVSLGHSNCAAEAAEAAFAAGARAVTHLYNAMSQLSARAPGLVGAALTAPVHAGIIADGVHVADAALRAALAAKDDRLFLVSDAMAVAGTDRAAFSLGGRRITRQDGRLTLADGTLAGADISLPQSVAHLVRLGCPPARALAMATRIPAALVGAAGHGTLAPGSRADFVHLDGALTLRAVWQGGAPLDRSERPDAHD
jgi:N-acetylglucosamine-6-phosphate deacetylase